MKSIALAVAATKKRDKWRADAIAANLPNQIEVGRCQFGGKGKFEPVTMELAGDRFTMETHLGAITRLTNAKKISQATVSTPKKVRRLTSTIYVDYQNHLRCDALLYVSILTPPCYCAAPTCAAGSQG